MATCQPLQLVTGVSTVPNADPLTGCCERHSPGGEAVFFLREPAFSAFFLPCTPGIYEMIFSSGRVTFVFFQILFCFFLKAP